MFGCVCREVKCCASDAVPSKVEGIRMLEVNSWKGLVDDIRRRRRRRCRRCLVWCLGAAAVAIVGVGDVGYGADVAGRRCRSAGRRIPCGHGRWRWFAGRG